MLKKRIIPMLLLSKGRMVKGVEFDNFRDVGNPVSQAKIYNSLETDELVFLDVDANRTGSDFDKMLAVIDAVSEECFMPLSVGGGIHSIEQVRALVKRGADKVVVTTAAIESPTLISDIAESFGRQCAVVGLDVRVQNGRYVLHSHCGQRPIDTPIEAFVQKMDALGAGEFIVNSIDRDGTQTGYDLNSVRLIKSLTKRPVVVAGGSGNFSHLVDAFKEADADGVGCGSIFHFGDNNPIRARAAMMNAGIPMKKIK